MKLLKLYTILSLMFVFSLFGQIVIDWDEIPHQVGTQWIKNSTDNVTVDLGSTGGPHTWDFTSQPMDDEFEYMIIADPSSNRFLDSFPGANLVYCSPADSDTAYQYYNLNSNYIALLGLAGVVSTAPFTWEYDPSDSLPLPQSYGSSYRFRYGFREEIVENSYLEHSHYGFSKCDAYGTVNIPYGSYNCLRTRTYDTLATTIYYDDIPIMYDTSTSINYGFVAEDYGSVVCIKSHPDETDTNYTDAYILIRLTLFLSGIEEKGKLIDVEYMHYPKLFSNYTTIQYSIPVQSHIELTFYDMSGRTVNTLVDDTQEKGSYSYRWYGNDCGGQLLASGIYFYRLKVGNNIYTDKVILMR